MDRIGNKYVVLKHIGKSYNVILNVTLISVSESRFMQLMLLSFGK